MSVDFGELTDWGKEMLNCKAVDPEFSVRNCNTESEISAETAIRLLRFIQRLNLTDKFIAEDKQGKR